MRLRNRPPSSFQIGTPSAWPTRSQQATSKAASADMATSPGRPYSATWMFHASRSTSKGSLPTTYRGASSWMQARSVSVLLTMRTSPSPTRPLSVSSSRKVSSRHGVPTTVVCRSMIFMAASWSSAVATSTTRWRPGRSAEAGTEAAIDREGDAGDEAGVLRGGKGDRRGDLVRLGDAAEGMDRQRLGPRGLRIRLLCQRLLHQAGPGPPGADCDHADPLTAVVEGEAAGQPDDPGLGRR